MYYVPVSVYQYSAVMYTIAIDLVLAHARAHLVTQYQITNMAEFEHVSSMQRANLEDIQSRFGSLLVDVKLALESNHVTPEAVCSALAEIFKGSLKCSFIPRTSLDKLFDFVRYHRPPLWDFMHHSPLQKLVSRCLPDHISMIDEYVQHLNGYCAATKLIDYIQDMNRQGWNRESNDLPLQNYTAVHYQVLKVNFKMNERNLSMLSLQYVQELWKQFAVEFDIPFLTAVIDKIMFSSLNITWLILPEMAAKITASCKSILFFKKNGIVYVGIDHKMIYEVCYVLCSKTLY